MLPVLAPSFTFKLNCSHKIMKRQTTVTQEATRSSTAFALHFHRLSLMAQEEIQETQEEEERSDNGETPTQASENEKPLEDAPAKTEETPPAEEENNETPEQQGESGDEEGEEETIGIKLETAPNDIRFPTTNQSRHCFTRYIEYHRCIAVKGEGAIDCQKFAKYYRSLCPGEWIEAWNEQREQGIFPGPL